MTFLSPSLRAFAFALILCLIPAATFAKAPRKATAKTKKVTKAGPKKAAVKASSKSKKKTVARSTTRKKGKIRYARRRGRNYVTGGPWTEPTFADSTLGDNIEGEDLTVRRAAVDALGPYNGTVVVTDPQSGRILTIVNQKVALGGGFQPCSTVKIYAALAGLTEGVIDRDTSVRLYGRTKMNLTTALARSNNPYFANIGVRLGFEKISYYARLYGLGEKAGLNVEGETLGRLPEAVPANGGMGMMTSFGEGIKLTPLQLASTLSAIANGGTLYWLQYPRSDAEAERFVPRIKRHLPIKDLIPDVKPGMLGAVEYGTARRAAYDPNVPILGKTGTCTDRATPTHLGWFGSFNEVGDKKLVVVVLLTGGRPVSGPVASGIAGQVYRNLSDQKFFAKTRTLSPVALVSGAAF